MKDKLRSVFKAEQMGLILALLAICILFSIVSPVFFSQTNLLNVLRQISLVAITGIGVSLIILLGEIDLSVGSAQAFIGIIVVTVLNKTESMFFAIVVGLLVGGLVGLINGVLVTKGKMNSLIVTLGMMSILRGVSLISTGASSIPVEVSSFGMLGAGFFMGIPIPVLITIVLFMLAYYVLNHMLQGREIYAIGGNSDSARLAGIPIVKVKICVFMISGVLTAVSAIILASRLDSAQPNAGMGFELQVIAAIVLGGVSLVGGNGSLVGALIGMLILGVLSNGLVLMQVSSFYQDLIRGVVIILAVYLDNVRKNSRLKDVKS